MSLSNRIENTIISAITALITIMAVVFIINITAIKPLHKQIEKQNELIKELAMLEKYQIENNFDKLKSHKGQIVLDLSNTMVTDKDSVEMNTDYNEVIIKEDKTKEGFFKRLFKKGK